MAMPTYPGQGASRQAIAQWMAARARAAGLPGELPVMAGLVESGLQNLSGGDRDSRGFFQMRSGIWDTGAYRGYANNPDLQMQWFIDQAKKANRGANLGEWVANIERPAEQYRGRYQTRLGEAQALLKGMAAGGSAMGDATTSPMAATGAPAAPALTRVQPTVGMGATLGSGTSMLQKMLEQNAALAKIPGIAMPTPAPMLQMPQWSPAAALPNAAQPGASGGAPGSPGGSIQFDPSSTDWGGSKTRAEAFKDMALNQFGLGVMSEKRDRKNTASGGVSDHWTGSKQSYAFDLSNGSSPTPEMDRAARYFANLLGVPDWKYGVLNANKDGYRYQLLYRTNVGGNHYNHIHLGVRRL